MKNVFVTPWVGKLYGKKDSYFNKKIMILGDSQYCDGCGDDCSASVENICNSRTEKIERYLNHKKCNGNFESWFPTYTKFTNLFIGKKCDSETINIFWNSILFYNYVQKALKIPREAPSPEMFKDKYNEEAFFEIIKKYKPDAIFVWGKRLWQNKTNRDFSSSRTILNRESGFYLSIPIFFTDHPSYPYIDYKCTKKYLQKVKIKIGLKTNINVI
ncbi:MAG: hypothetical protein FWG99_05650 [Treponema sp.]|nr:hypothetical protein [Treponema sp.]